MQADQQFLGIEIGGTKLQLAVSGADESAVQVTRYAIDATGGAAAIKNQIEAAWNSLPNKDAIAAIGVGFGGPVDWQTGTIRVSHQVSGWSDFQLAQWLRQLSGRPVQVQNDANVAALAEALYGSGKESERVFYMTIGSGIGGGLIINGNIYHGRAPGEVEIGHLRLGKDGPTLEESCSGWAVNKRVRTLIDKEPNGLLAQIAYAHTGPEALLLQPALEQCDRAAKKLAESVADDIAFALSHVVHLFHPDVIVIGGGLSLLGEHLRQPVAHQLPRYLMHAFLPAPPVQIATLGEKVVPIGALQLAKNLLF
jgi:glucokinase